MIIYRPFFYVIYIFIYIIVSIPCLLMYHHIYIVFTDLLNEFETFIKELLFWSQFLHVTAESPVNSRSAK